MPLGMKNSGEGEEILCIPFYLQDLLNFDDPLNVEASELYFKNKVGNEVHTL